MGFLDELKDKAEEFEDTVKEGLGGGRDKSENVIENVKDSFDRDNTLAEAGDAANSAAEAASDAPEGIKGAVANTTDSAGSAAGDATDAAQDSADSLKEAAADAADSAASAVESKSESS